MVSSDNKKPLESRAVLFLEIQIFLYPPRVELRSLRDALSTKTRKLVKCCGRFRFTQRDLRMMIPRILTDTRDVVKIIDLF